MLEKLGGRAVAGLRRRRPHRDPGPPCDGRRGVACVLDRERPLVHARLRDRRAARRRPGRVGMATRARAGWRCADDCAAAQRFSAGRSSGRALAPGRRYRHHAATGDGALAGAQPRGLSARRQRPSTRTARVSRRAIAARCEPCAFTFQRHAWTHGSRCRNRPPEPRRHLYLCGPGAMVQDARCAARALGWPEPAVHAELFNAGTAPGDIEFEVTLRRSE